MVPGDPSEPAAVGREGRSGVEVVALGEDAWGHAAVGGDHSQEVVHSSVPVPLPHADQVAAVRGHDRVGVPPRPLPGRLGCDGRRGLAGSQPIETLVGEVGDVSHAVVHH